MTYHVGTAEHKDGYSGRTAVAQICLDVDSGRFLAVYPHGYHAVATDANELVALYPQMTCNQFPQGIEGGLV